jgi:hypothetical protein
VARRFLAFAQARKQVEHTVHVRGDAPIPAGPQPAERAHVQVLPHRHRRKHPAPLRNQRHPGGEPVGGRTAGQILAVHADLTRLRAQQPGDAAHQG